MKKQRADRFPVYAVEQQSIRKGKTELPALIKIHHSVWATEHGAYLKGGINRQNLSRIVRLDFSSYIFTARAVGDVIQSIICAVQGVCRKGSVHCGYNRPRWWRTHTK